MRCNDGGLLALAFDKLALPIAIAAWLASACPRLIKTKSFMAIGAGAADIDDVANDRTKHEPPRGTGNLLTQICVERHAPYSRQARSTQCLNKLNFETGHTAVPTDC